MHIPGIGMEGGHFGDLATRLDGFIWTDIKEFQKAVVSSGYGTDVANFTGGRALQLQSIENSLLATVQENRHFKAFNGLGKSNATATVDEYTQQDTVGGFLGGSFNSETGAIPESQANYRRRTLNIKYLMTMRRVSVVQQSTTGVVDTVANQTKSAILQLLSDAEWGIFYGDSDMVEEEFDGVEKFVAGQAPADHIVDLRGRSLSPMAAEFVNAAQLISSYGSFGELTNAYMSNLVAADLDQKLDPAFRVNVGESAGPKKVGAPIAQVVTRWGNIAADSDIFIREGDMPMQFRSTELGAIVTAAGVNAPVSVTGTAASPGSGETSLFETAHAGLYYYAAEGGNKNGRSVLTKSSQVAIAAGQKCTVAIVEASSGTGNETYYMLYRSRRNGTNGNTDFREMVRVKKLGTGTTTYVDLNQNIPGSSKMFLFTQKPDAITLRRLLPMTKFALYPTNTPVIPWAHLLFMALRVGKPNQHVVIRNVIPSGQTWRPF